MSIQDKLVSTVNGLPAGQQQEVLNFAEYLKSKRKEGKRKPFSEMRGIYEGKMKMSEDFDYPLEDFKDYM